MKEIEISNRLFNIAVNAVSKFTSHDEVRPVLKKIKCEVTRSTIEFIAVDGYKGIRYKINHNSAEVEPFEFVFYPFMVEVDKRELNRVKISYTNGKVLFTYKDKEGCEIVKSILNAEESFLNYAEVENMRTEEQSHISIKTRYLLETMQAISKTGADYVTLHYFGENKPLIVTTRPVEFGDARALILPIREL